MSYCPAAFGRLCVETAAALAFLPSITQPPSGGCVLKRRLVYTAFDRLYQPPSGGCVLKLLLQAHR